MSTLKPEDLISAYRSLIAQRPAAPKRFIEWDGAPEGQAIILSSDTWALHPKALHALEANARPLVVQINRLMGIQVFRNFRFTGSDMRARGNLAWLLAVDPVAHGNLLTWLREHP